MSHGVKYFLWRDGRPRWHPNAGARARGFRGQDLKAEDGSWLELGPALEKARALNTAAGIENSRRAAPLGLKKGSQGNTPADPERGYVYFLLVGDTVKIGFSTNPFGRRSSLITGLAAVVEMYAFVEGTREDEAYLHYLLREHRLQGEWFSIRKNVLWTILHVLRFRRVSRKLHLGRPT